MKQILPSLFVCVFAVCCLPQQMPGQTSDKIPDKVRKFGSKRPRAPKGWAKLDWDKKKAILFGQYAPTADEERLIDEAVAKVKPTQESTKRKLLIFYRCQYPHASIATGNMAFEKLATATGAYEATLSDDPADINPEYLAQFDAVLLNNTTNFDITIGAAGQKALMAFVKSGKGLIGIHSASDSCHRWKGGRPLFNGVFQCHPWLPKGTWAFRLESPSHPLNAAFGGQGFWHRDEVYIYKPGTHSRTQSRVLVSIDPTQAHNRESKDLHPKHAQLAQSAEIRPVAWIHDFEKGRVFYSNFGHNNSTFWQSNVLQHYLDGIQYALGDIEADATPSSEIDSPELATAPAK